MMNGWYGDGAAAGGWFLMAVGMVFFWGLVVVAVMVVLRGAGAGTTSVPMQPSSRDPRAILDERFARSEIDADEYRARQDALVEADRART